MDKEMPLTICFYEDNKYSNFFPLTYLRPVYVLRAGIVPLYKRVERHFIDVDICLSCREQLAPILANVQKEIPVNIIKKGDNDILLVNGRIRHYGDLVKMVQESKISTLFKNNGETVAIILKVDDLKELPAIAAIKDYQEYISHNLNDILDFDTTATLYNYCWEIMADIETEIISDYNFYRQSFPSSQNVNVHEGVFQVKEDDIYLGNDVEILPGSILDAGKGPIYIDANTRIEAHVAIYGPTYIGANSQIVAGKISSSSIGNTCRVGGEVEHSVFHSYINKYHAGFIGHSYIGSWVNFGAMTTNSDLKNNYSNIRVSLKGESINTNTNKVGSFVGDHTKFGIGTLLTTGINIGVGCNIFGGSQVNDKEVASFSWGSSGNFVKHDIEKAIETAKIASQRRNCTLSDSEVSLLKAISLNNINNDGVLDI